MIYNFNQQTINNLMIFLDRVEINGLQEVQVMNEIITQFKNEGEIEINDNMLNNILVLLDRIKYKGFKELQAINEILNILKNPKQEEPKETQIVNTDEETTSEI